MRPFLAAALLIAALSVAPAQSAVLEKPADSDHDGLSDALEEALLTQFAPRFMVSGDDCAGRPAKFVPSVANPAVQQEDGTIYGQAFPRPGNAGQVELHYYHLWRSDCGEMSHDRDAEHVSVLVEPGPSSEWKALYWFAAAHEDTLCDESQIARAASVDGELHGPRVWVSRGKHASFLSDAICAHGCGGDDCSAVELLTTPEIINLGELSAPMNGATWAASPLWPLAKKMSRSDFSEARTTRVDGLADAGITWANPGKKPMIAIIHGGNNALGATGSALDTADVHTDNALNTASDKTSNSLAKALRSVKKALGFGAPKAGTASEKH